MALRCLSATVKKIFSGVSLLKAEIRECLPGVEAAGLEFRSLWCYSRGGGLASGCNLLIRIEGWTWWLRSSCSMAETLCLRDATPPQSVLDIDRDVHLPPEESLCWLAHKSHSNWDYSFEFSLFLVTGHFSDVDKCWWGHFSLSYYLFLVEQLDRSPHN